jgi:hypothetical protein
MRPMTGNLNDAVKIVRSALADCPPEFGRVHIANDLIFWTDAHAKSVEGARAFIKSACDEALTILAAMEDAG